MTCSSMKNLSTTGFTKTIKNSMKIKLIKSITRIVSLIKTIILLVVEEEEAVRGIKR